MQNRTLLSLTSLIITTFTLTAHAADITGTWKAEFDTQIGLQKYTFILKQEDAQVSGKAISDIEGEKREVELKECKLDGNIIMFVEILKFQDNEIRISYTGKVTGDEIKFTRNVGDFATEELTAKREKTETSPAAAPDRARRIRQRQQIVLGPDDKPAFPTAPEGFDKIREDIARGKVDTVEYNSKTVGNKRKMLIYIPPEYSTDTKYPVLYLLHGIGGDETEWHKMPFQISFSTTFTPTRSLFPCSL